VPTAPTVRGGDGTPPCPVATLPPPCVGDRACGAVPRVPPVPGAGSLRIPMPAPAAGLWSPDVREAPAATALRCKACETGGRRGQWRVGESGRGRGKEISANVLRGGRSQGSRGVLAAATSRNYTREQSMRAVISPSTKFPAHGFLKSHSARFPVRCVAAAKATTHHKQQRPAHTHAIGAH
jgi:hypothetical protein